MRTTPLKVWHSNDRYRKIIYQCNRKYADGHKCGTPHFTEKEIKRLFVKAVNQLLSDKDELLKNAEFMRKVVCDTSEQEKELNDLDEEIGVLVERINAAIGENARVAQDQNEYQQGYEELIRAFFLMSGMCCFLKLNISIAFPFYLCYDCNIKRTADERLARIISYLK